MAKLAGVPSVLLQKAAVKLHELESGAGSLLTEPDAVPESSRLEEEQLSFFTSRPDPVKEKLKNLDLMHLTPSQAFQILEELKEAAGA